MPGGAWSTIGEREKEGLLFSIGLMERKLLLEVVLFCDQHNDSDDCWSATAATQAFNCELFHLQQITFYPHYVIH